MKSPWTGMHLGTGSRRTAISDCQRIFGPSAPGGRMWRAISESGIYGKILTWSLVRRFWWHFSRSPLLRGRGWSCRSCRPRRMTTRRFRQTWRFRRGAMTRASSRFPFRLTQRPRTPCRSRSGATRTQTASSTGRRRSFSSAGSAAGGSSATRRRRLKGSPCRKAVCGVSNGGWPLTALAPQALFPRPTARTTSASPYPLSERGTLLLLFRGKNYILSESDISIMKFSS